jgi:transmembrane sensor
VSEKDKTSSLDRWDVALTWYSRLRAVDESELTSALRREWEGWYTDAENRRVFDCASRLLAEHDLHLVTRRPTREELEEDTYDLSVPIAKWLSARQLEEAGRRDWFGSKWRWALGGAAIAAAVVALFVLSPQRAWLRGGRGGPGVYQTGRGGKENVHLQDGSAITLGGQTRLLVSFSAQRRFVKLLEGQAWFTVAHNSRWPFVVSAGDGTITAVGTAFLVTRDSDRMVVTVTDGVVEVSARPPSPIEGPALVSIRVSRGEELALHDNGALSHIKPADTQAATAWTQGRLTFDNQPLRYVIETVDRYSSRHIVVSPSAGGLRFTGIVFDNEIDDWLQSLVAIFPVTLEEQGTAVRIEMRSSTPATRGVSRTTQP